MTDNSWNGIEGLTAEQVARLTDSQRRKVMPNAELRGLARSMAADNLLGALYSDVAPPADATTVYGWCDMGDDDGHNGVMRLWTGSSWVLTNGARVVIGGVQSCTGGTTRFVSLESSDDSDGEMTAEQAREAAAALQAAAEELDKLNGDAPPF